MGMEIVGRAAFAAEMALDGETVATLYGYFAEELADDMAEMDAAAARRDGDAFTRLVHKMKGTSASYHADVLHACLADADRYCKAGELEAAFGLAAELRASAEAALREISGWS